MLFRSRIAGRKFSAKLVLGASHFGRIWVGVVPLWLSASVQNQGNHGGFAPTQLVKSLKWDGPLALLKPVSLNLESLTPE